MEIYIHMRDPFFLKEGDTYYLYGTHGGKLYVFYGEDLHALERKLVFEDTEGVYTQGTYWAPEVHKIGDTYYMIATFKKEGEARHCRMLTCDTPNGEFVPMEKPLTPPDWECLDGTLWQEDGKLYLFFCHEWTQIGDGTVCVAELDENMQITGEVTTLFAASEAPWVLPHDGKNYVTDGPFLYRLKDGRLLMAWSSFGDRGYAMGMAVSDSIPGPWTHLEEPLLKENGGHGMFFEDDGQLYVTYHSPNGPDGMERVQLQPIVEENGKLYIARKRG